MGLARNVLFGLLVSAPVAGAACAPPDTSLTDEGEVRVDTRSREARKQYDANVAFAKAYVPRCRASDPGRRRVLVTGFGRFMDVADNATGRIVSTLVPSARYPETAPPAPGRVDPPAPQLSVGNATLALPNAGKVDVCAMILPVYWDLAAILVAKELDRFEPSFVMMNGVAGSRQDLWIELGATNKAAGLDDGSGHLRPDVAGALHAPIVEGVPESENARGNLLSWNVVASTARKSIESHANEADQDARFGDILPGMKLAGFPRDSNTYLCNNVTYAIGYLMSHPQTTVPLLRASPPLPGAVNEVPIRLARDFGATPRVFVHWPSELATKHVVASADVMKTIMDAQLAALSSGETPTIGDNALADPTLRGGGFF